MLSWGMSNFQTSTRTPGYQMGNPSRQSGCDSNAALYSTEMTQTLNCDLNSELSSSNLSRQHESDSDVILDLKEVTRKSYSDPNNADITQQLESAPNIVSTPVVDKSPKEEPCTSAYLSFCSQPIESRHELLNVDKLENGENVDRLSTSHPIEHHQMNTVKWTNADESNIEERDKMRKSFHI